MSTLTWIIEKEPERKTNETNSIGRKKSENFIAAVKKKKGNASGQQGKNEQAVKKKS